MCRLIWDYFIAFRRLAPVTIYMLTHYDREYEELQLTLCSLRMFLVKCGMIATQVQNLGLCVEGVCETRAHFPQSVDTATFPLRFRWLKAQGSRRLKGKMVCPLCRPSHSESPNVAW